MEMRKTADSMAGHGDPKYMRTGMTNSDVRIAEQRHQEYQYRERRLGEEKGEWNVQGITSNDEKWRPGMGSNEKQSGINVYRDKQTKTDEWTTEPLKQKGDVGQFTELTWVSDKT